MTDLTTWLSILHLVARMLRLVMMTLRRRMRMVIIVMIARSLGIHLGLQNPGIYRTVFAVNIGLLVPARLGGA